MKKHRKLLNKTDYSFFSNAQFKLKSSELPKERPRRTSNILSHLKNQILFQDSKSLVKQKSRQKHSILEKLQFVSTQQDNFKLPKSLSKRSKLRASEEDQRNKNKININDLSHLNIKKPYMAQISNAAKQKKMTIADFMIFKRSKGISSREIKKEKIEKSALQRFNNMANNENSQNENKVNEQKAEALYLLLQSNRKNFYNKNSQIQDRSSKGYENDGLQDQQLHSQPTKNQKPQNSKNNQKNITPQEEQPTPKQKQNAKKNQFKNVVCKIEYQKEDFEESLGTDSQQIQQNQKNKSNQRKNQQFRKQDTKGVGEEHVNRTNNNNKIKQQDKASKFVEKKQLQNKIIQNRNKEKASQNNKKLISKKQQENIQIQSYKKTNNQQQVKRIIKQNQQSLKKSIKLTSPTNDQNNKHPDQTLKNIQIESIPHINTYNKQTPKSTSNKKIQRQQKGKDEDKFSKKSIEDIKGKQVKQKIEFNKNNINIKSGGGIKGQKISSDYQDDQVQQVIFTGNIKKQQKNLPSQSQKDKNNKKTQTTQTKDNQNNIQTKKQDKPKASNKLLPPPSLNPLPKQQTSPQQPVSQQSIEQQQETQNSPLDNFVYYIQRLQDIGQYRMKSKDLYSDKSIDKQLVQIHKICAYFIAHQFFYLAKMTYNIIKQNPITRQYYSLSLQELNQIRSNGDLDSEITMIESNLQQSKKLLRKCYDQCKMYLPKQQQLLILQGKINYHIKCCSLLIKQFKKIYQLYIKNTSNKMLLERSIYLIEIYCILKTFNHEEIKPYQQFQDIEDPIKHLEQYKSLFI